MREAIKVGEDPCPLQSAMDELLDRSQSLFPYRRVLIVLHDSDNERFTVASDGDIRAIISDVYEELCEDE